MMWLTHTAVGKPLAIVAIFMAVVIAGIASFFALPINLFPKFDVPVVVVTTAWVGASPNEVELQITRPIEDAVAGLQNIDNITSTSGQGISSVVITFTDKANSDLIDSQVQRQLATVQGQLPTDPSQAITPITSKVDPNSLPIMQVALVSDTMSNTDLYSLANDTLSPQLQQVTGVSQVSVVGGQKQEVQVLVDPNKLAGRGLSLTSLQTALTTGNTAVPAGSLTQDPNTYNLRVSNLAVQPQDLGRITIGGTAEAPVRVSDVANVQLTGQQQSQITRVNGHNGVLFRLSAQTGANTTDVSDGVNRLLPQLQSQLPAGAQLVKVQDNSVFIRSSVNGVLEELVSAIILTSVVLLLFLHSPRVSLIVLLSIPTTLLATFSIMRVLDFSLNFISTLALILTIGILVDDSIVILENTLRHLSRGESPRAAAINGRAEIGLAALTITLVDVVIFAPTGLVSGQVGAFFKEFGFTIAAATLCSLIISFTLTPMLASRLLKRERTARQGPVGALLALVGRPLRGSGTQYHRLLEWCFEHRWAPLVAAFAVLVGGIALVPLGAVPVEFFPNIDQGTIAINTTVAPGTSLDGARRVMRQIENQLAEVPEIKTYSASIGASQTFGIGAASVTQGTVAIDIGSRQEPGQVRVCRGRRYTRARRIGIPNATIQVQVNGGNGAGQAELDPHPGPGCQRADVAGRSARSAHGAGAGAHGCDQQRLRRATRSCRSPSIPRALRSSASRRRPSAAPSERRTRVSSPPSGGAPTANRSTCGSCCRMPRASNISALGVVPLQTTSGLVVPLNQVATIAQVPTPNEIDRRDRQRVVTVGARPRHWLRAEPGRPRGPGAVASNWRCRPATRSPSAATRRSSRRHSAISSRRWASRSCWRIC